MPGLIKKVVKEYTKEINVSNTKIKIGGTYGIERDAYEEIRRHNYEVDIMMDLGLKKIDMSFLSMTNKDKSPAFAVYSLDNPRCYFTVRAFSIGDRMLSPINVCSVSSRIYKYYEQAMLKNRPRWFMLSRIDYEHRFYGLIPDTTKQKIEKCRNKFDEIVIVAEATNWNVKKVQIPKDRDPLVIGRKGDDFYLIDVFDITTAEDMVRREFTA